MLHTSVFVDGGYDSRAVEVYEASEQKPYRFPHQLRSLSHSNQRVGHFSRLLKMLNSCEEIAVC